MLDNLNGALTVTGGGATTLTLDDSGSVAAKSMVVSNTSVSGLSPAAVSAIVACSALNVPGRQRGASTVTVNSTAPPGVAATTTIDTGSGDDAFTIVPASGAMWRGCRWRWQESWSSMAAPAPTP